MPTSKPTPSISPDPEGRDGPGARRRIVVIGAGIVGLCCALWLQRKGHRVLLVDGNEPGTGASSGSACTIATHECLPINRPDLIRDLPKYLFGRTGKGGPLAIDPIYAIRHAPWFVRFLKHCRAESVAQTTTALGHLLAQANEGLTPLLDMADCAHLLADNGCLYAYQSQRDFHAHRENLRTRRRHGVQYTELDADELRRLEPALKIDCVRGVLFTGARNVSDPQALTDAFFACFRNHGGEWRKQHAQSISIRRNHHALAVHLANGETVAAYQVIVAAGAFSRQIAGSGASRLPLGVERGHHIQFNGQAHLAHRPIHWVGSGFYAVPTSAGLRFAGTVELGGLTPRKNRRMLAYLKRTAKRMFDLAGEPDQTWLGYRPTFPDALPVIGTSPRSANILLAFGHQHLGLTLAGITGKLIAQLVDGESVSVDIAPFRADRFG